MHALIVEDEAKAATFLSNGLSENGWSVDVTGDGIAALEFLQEKSYDIVLLDVLLPGNDGWSVIRKIRASGIVTPVIFLTARDSLGERIRGLDLGADDYLVKPFAFSELMARIRTILRRGRDTNPTILKISDLEVDLIRHKVIRQNLPIELTPREFALLELLARTPNEVVGRRLIAKELWNMEAGADSNTVDVAVRRLRRKVDHPFEKSLIHSVYGVGYVLGERSANIVNDARSNRSWSLVLRLSVSYAVVTIALLSFSGSPPLLVIKRQFGGRCPEYDKRQDFSHATDLA
jgi:two-component system copper resistance phosphate regulon response regulator CusR